MTAMLVGILSAALLVGAVVALHLLRRRARRRLAQQERKPVKVTTKREWVVVNPYRITDAQRDEWNSIVRKVEQGMQEGLEQLIRDALTAPDNAFDADKRAIRRADDEARLLEPFEQWFEQRASNDD